MKNILLFVLILSGLVARAETPEAILAYFKTKDRKQIVACATYPFRIEFGSSVDASAISDAITLEGKLSYLFRHGYFDGIEKGKLIKESELQLLIETHTYNKQGEMESESAFIFQFRKTQDGYKLCGLTVAG